jgi:hypothetical protein
MLPPQDMSALALALFRLIVSSFVVTNEQARYPVESPPRRVFAAARLSASLKRPASSI